MTTTLPRGRGESPGDLAWEDPPGDLKLVQAQYIVRHGERAPVRRRLLQADPPMPVRWNLCHATRQFHHSVLQKGQSADEFVSLHAKIHRTVEYAHEPEPTTGDAGDCLLGELTDLGRVSMLRLGSKLYGLYGERLGLIPRDASQYVPGMFYFRSTYMERTLKSLEQLMTGLFAGHAPTFVPKLYVRNVGEENMLPNVRDCPRLAELIRRFERSAAELYNPQLAALDSVISPHNNGRPPRVDGQPRLSGLIDTIRVAQAHNIPIPEPFKDPETMALMEKAVVQEWFAGYGAADPEVRRQFRSLSIGSFLGSLYSRMEHAANSISPLRLAVYMCHDATLIGILQSLECFNGHWPDFAASIGLELFRGNGHDKPSSTSYPPNPDEPTLASEAPSNYFSVLGFGFGLFIGVALSSHGATSSCMA
ncbi:acid phosphatase [Malassezia cuniculi]|uniref:Acid phosphatase n=1 Tax=Malassezia cuniculi TaxID=948313 RepID=A0AAF0ERS7_9BASI|nr:acid phosphatase [Malassezia cuniculi]